MSPLVQDMLGPGGLIAKALGDYEERPEQLGMAVAVEQALAEEEHLLAEAGTGVGKSFAYLLPAILHAIEHRGQGPVVVSTRTIALQQQLEHKDLPFLRQVLPEEFVAVVAVGRNHYLCLRRMHLAQKERGLLFAQPEFELSLQAILQWSMDTKAGTRMALPEPVANEVWDEVKAEHQNCLHRACPHYRACHYQRSRRRMHAADILVANHALYVADVALRLAGTSYLPVHRVSIFDEAHHLHRIATEGLGLRLGHGTVQWHLRRLHPKRGKNSLLMRHGSARSQGLARQVRTLSGAFFEDLESRLGQAGGDTLGLGGQELDLGLADLLGELGSALEVDAAGIQDLDQALEMQARARGFSGMAEGLQALCRESDANLVRWIEGRKPLPELRAAPLDVSQALGQAVFAEQRTAILTSATLDPGAHDFQWTRRQLGIQKARNLRLGSPFRYGEQVELLLEDDLPDPGREAEAFLFEAKQKTCKHILENGGRALVLCTSWRFVHEFREYLLPHLEAAGLRLLVQGEATLVELLRQKMQDKNSVLLGTDSLWEGIDLPGAALTLLILARLPFAQPGHPLQKARIEAIEARGGSGFFEQSLPEAILKFRQGFGRLVRRNTDRGKVVVLDPRIRTRRYGRNFLAALPPELLSGSEGIGHI